MITVGTLSNLIKHGDVLLDLLRGANTPQTYANLKHLIGDTPDALHDMGALLAALDGLEQNLRALRLAETTLVVKP